MLRPTRDAIHGRYHLIKLKQVIDRLGTTWVHTAVPEWIILIMYIGEDILKRKKLFLSAIDPIIYDDNDDWNYNDDDDGNFDDNDGKMTENIIIFESKLSSFRD